MKIILNGGSTLSYKTYHRNIFLIIFYIIFFDNQTPVAPFKFYHAYTNIQLAALYYNAIWAAVYYKLFQLFLYSFLLCAYIYSINLSTVNKQFWHTNKVNKKNNQKYFFFVLFYFLLCLFKHISFWENGKFNKQKINNKNKKQTKNR